jgi:hypothetical protein
MPAALPLHWITRSEAVALPFATKRTWIMSTIRIFRPKRDWSVSPATVLPTALLVGLFKPHWNYTVILDGLSAGKIGNEQVRVFNVKPGEHRLCMRFVLLRRSEEMRMSLKEDEERQFLRHQRDRLAHPPGSVA